MVYDKLLAAANLAQKGMQDTFLAQDYAKGRLFKSRIPFKGELHYWWQAHAIDALLDGYLRTGDEKLLALARDEVKYVKLYNGGHLINDYYDDMEWMALALLRLWEVTQVDCYREDAYKLWRNILTGWNDHCGGGIAWRKTQLDYKNTPANAPAAILGFRLYRLFEDQEALEWAEKIYDWQINHLIDPNGYVYDGINRQGDGKIDYDWAYTYCQGVVIGAAVERWRIHQEDKDLALAFKVARESERRFFAPHGGVMDYEGADDCGLFRGIYFRYLVQLMQEKPEETWLHDQLVRNALSIADLAMDEQGRIGGHWKSKPGEHIDLAQQACGVMVLEFAVQQEKPN